MSVYVMSWVFTNSPTKLGDRLVLLSLADYAHDDGTRAFPSVESLARKARVGKSTAREALRRLEKEGHIVQEGMMPSGVMSYRVLMRAPDSGGGPESSTPPPESSTRAPDSGANPSVNPSGNTSSKGNAREQVRAKAQTLPDDFPEALKPHARRVFAILREVAEQHNAKEVTPRGVGLAIMRYPGRQFVGVAYDLASWAQNGRPVKDAVSTYRTFLGKADVHAGIESLDGPTVTPIAAFRGRTRDGWTGADAIAIGRRMDEEARARGELVG